MIIKNQQLAQVSHFENRFLATLVYGPNEGLVRECIKEIKRLYLKENEFEDIQINAKDIDDDPLIIDQSINTISMFSEFKVVLVNSIKDKHIKILESVMQSAPDKTLFIIKENNLTTASKVRKFFDKDPTYFSIACYDDDGKDLMKSINTFAEKNSLVFNRDVKNYLLENLSSDRMINQNELEKIHLYYSKSKDSIELNDVKFLLNDSSSQNLQKMSQTVMYGKTGRSSDVLNKILTEGTNPIAVIRSLIIYLKRIQATKIHMKRGADFEVAIKNLKPPVFWKEKDSFKIHCQKWPLKIIEKNLSDLLDAEVQCKSDSNLAKIICERFITEISHRGSQYYQ